MYMLPVAGHSNSPALARRPCYHHTEPSDSWNQVSARRCLEVGTIVLCRHSQDLLEDHWRMDLAKERRCLAREKRHLDLDLLEDHCTFLDKAHSLALVMVEDQIRIYHHSPFLGIDYSGLDQAVDHRNCCSLDVTFC